MPPTARRDFGELRQITHDTSHPLGWSYRYVGGDGGKGKKSHLAGLEPATFRRLALTDKCSQQTLPSNTHCSSLSLLHSAGYEVKETSYAANHVHGREHQDPPC